MISGQVSHSAPLKSLCTSTMVLINGDHGLTLSAGNVGIFFLLLRGLIIVLEDVITMIDPNQPGQWKMEEIVETFPAKDGLVTKMGPTRDPFTNWA